MSPPLSAAVGLLGVWILMVFLVTNATGSAQSRATQYAEDSETHTYE